ncbi:SOS response-associated peptidase [Cognatiyoonia sp. IB215446]|uniref:SOS response-associated peptidase n=1 Tax=Cognatiyoonia sp. IB215446 TaxID=3097355 RepID=UPI002A17A56A|nr:SOS response-associated peptidase [Cognatiyoonia sp. IB215446]MDX8347867.1 SOS response-associated peptidase [Cognatiyoonia sp. IB215446]
MPGRFFLTREAAGMADAPRYNIAPGQEVITLTSDGAQHMRWGMIPVGRVNARGRPVMETIVNARSETVFDKSAFADVKRAVVPVEGWYEWTGERRRKQPWRISRKDGELLYFAAIYDIWHGPGGIEVSQVATITCAPSADVRDIHHRMGVILNADQVDLWFSSDEATAKSMMQPYPDGMLHVEKADDVDWDGA